MLSSMQGQTHRGAAYSHFFCSVREGPKPYVFLSAFTYKRLTAGGTGLLRNLRVSFPALCRWALSLGLVCAGQPCTPPYRLPPSTRAPSLQAFRYSPLPRSRQLARSGFTDRFVRHPHSARSGQTRKSPRSSSGTPCCARARATHGAAGAS